MDQTILDRYNLPTLDVYVASNQDLASEATLTAEYYAQFLRATDYVTAKLIEAQVLNVECEDYADVLAARQFARSEISRLKGEA